MIEWLRRCLEEESGKTSIKRIMLFLWFIIMSVQVFTGVISWEMITIFGMLLGNKSVEEIVKKYNR